MFERFTDRARKMMAYANQEANNFSHEYIGTEHILLGLVKEGSGVGANVLKNLGVDLFRVRLEIEKLIKRGPTEPSGGKLPQTPRAKKVIEYAIAEARGLNHNYVGTEHLLLGLMREDGVAAQVLKNLGVDLQKARMEIIDLLGAGSTPNDPPAELTEPVGPPPSPKSMGTIIGELVSSYDKQLFDLNRQKDDLIRSADYEKAADVRDQTIALIAFKEFLIKFVLDIKIDAAATGRSWGQQRAQMLAQLAVALIESSPELVAQLGDTLEKLRKASEP